MSNWQLVMLLLAEQTGKGIACGRGLGTRWSLMSLPIQTILGFYKEFKNISDKEAGKDSKVKSLSQPNQNTLKEAKGRISVENTIKYLNG